MPRVSVITPVYNHERFIAECVESILAQTYNDFEIIVVDDGSTDRTPEILATYKDRITVIRQPNAGGAAALNTALKQARGEYIAWLSSDDVFTPTKLQEQVDFLDNNARFSLVYTDFYYNDTQGSILAKVRAPYFNEKKSFLYHMLVANFINGSTVMFKRTCIDSVGPFDATMRFHADGDLWFRMLKYFEFGHISKPLLKYRWHASNLSHHFREMKRFYRLYYQKIFQLYEVSDFFPEGITLSEAYFQVAEILERHRMYPMAFSKLAESFRIQPSRIFQVHRIFFFLIKFPLLSLIDVGLRLFSWEQRHFHNNFIAYLYFKLNNRVATVS